MYNYDSNWSEELKAAERRRYRAECKVRCLTSALDRVDPTGFDALMDQIEVAQTELQAAGEHKLDCLWRWFSAKKESLRMSQIIFDPRERCDCQDKEKAAPVLQHQDGSKVESELSDPHSPPLYEKTRRKSSMNIILNRTGITVTRDLSSPPPNGVCIDFVQSMVDATRKFRKMGCDDARAGKVFSADEICRKLEARFTYTDPLVAHAVARVLSNCYEEGAMEELR